jgi:K+ potassium transporter C-terminal domain
MASFMMFWRWGMAKKRSYEWDHRVRLSQLLRRDGELPHGEGAFILGERPPIPTQDSVEKPVTTTNEKEPNIDTTRNSSEDSMAIHSVHDSSTNGAMLRKVKGLYLRSSGIEIARLPGISIYYTLAPTSSAHAPHTFQHFLQHFPALHSTCIFLHVRTAAQPHVSHSERLLLEPSPLWDGVWRGVYRVGYMELPDFADARFTVSLFDKLGRQPQGVTHVMQWTTLRAKKEKEAQGAKRWRRIPESLRAWVINVLWGGIDDALSGVAHGWKVPVGDVVSVGAVAEV